MQKPDLKALERFLDSEDEFRLTKLASKRDNSQVPVGRTIVGDFSFQEWPATDKLPEQTGVFISGRGFNIIGTSPVIKIIDQSENSTTFETEGGVYKLEKYVPSQAV